MPNYNNFSNAPTNKNVKISKNTSKENSQSIPKPRNQQSIKIESRFVNDGFTPDESSQNHIND